MLAHIWGRGTFVLLGVALAAAAAFAQEPAPPPAQPPEEVRIASEFEAAAPALFAAWLAQRSAVLDAAGLGTEAQPLGYPCRGTPHFFRFITCRDNPQPSTYSFD